jgi:hypothetical protein
MAMKIDLALRIQEMLPLAEQQYYRLILVVGSSGKGKTGVLRGVAAVLNLPIINVNLELSKRMLDLIERKRPLFMPQLLKEIINGAVSEIVLLDNIEICFDRSLKQDPLRILEGLSRNKTLVVAWNGKADANMLTYAAPEHQEFRKYPIKDILVLKVEEKEKNNAHDRG